ncbi:MAG: hypothetical protein ACFFD2_29920 [Promethearchaeota archaeon]
MTFYSKILFQNLLLDTWITSFSSKLFLEKSYEGHAEIAAWELIKKALPPKLQISRKTIPPLRTYRFVLDLKGFRSIQYRA